MGTNLITAADAILTLTVASLYTAPVRIQGFASDEAFDFGDVDLVETMLGVDGKLSAGWVPTTFMQNISLQADSDSNEIFEQWHLFQAQLRTPLIASGTVLIPATGRKLDLTKGFLKGYSPAPAAKKVLQPRKYSILWNKVTPSAYAGL